tara:strand:+ start:2595 stop:2786 length:192 start_codon:yes stop_codon:yes gene_type:complete
MIILFLRVRDLIGKATAFWATIPNLFFYATVKSIGGCSNFIAEAFNNYLVCCILAFSQAFVVS